MFLRNRGNLSSNDVIKFKVKFKKMTSSSSRSSSSSKKSDLGKAPIVPYNSTYELGYALIFPYYSTYELGYAQYE